MICKTAINVKLFICFLCSIFWDNPINSREYACIIDQKSNYASLIDVENNHTVLPITIDGLYKPRAITITPNGKYVYIVNGENNSISIFDVKSGYTLVQRLTKGISCACNLAITPNGKYAYVANLGNDDVLVIDVEKDHAIIKRISDCMNRPYDLTISPSGKYVYVTNLGNNTVSVIDVEADHNVVQVISKGINLPFGIAITPDERWAYVANGGNGSIAVISIQENNQVCQWIQGMNSPHGIAIDPSGRYAYIANYDTGVAIVDIAQGNIVIDSITESMNNPYAIAINKNGKYVYVANKGDHSIAIIDIEKNNQIVKIINNWDNPQAIIFINEADVQNNSNLNLSICHLYDVDSLMDERKQLNAYLNDFPHKEYQVYFSNDTGYFYVDNIDEPIKNTIKQGKIWEKHVHDAVKKYTKPGTTVLDIGAHIGTESILMAKCVGPEGQVHAFEPQKKIFRELWANCLLNGIDDRITLYHMGVGSHHEIVEAGEILESWEEAAVGLWGGGDSIELRTIDSFNFDNVSLIKIDVEGSEDDVIDGMVETINKCHPTIVIEICGGWGWDLAPPDIRANILYTQSKLIKLGYEIHHLGSWDYLALPKK